MRTGSSVLVFMGIQRVVSILNPKLLLNFAVANVAVEYVRVYASLCIYIGFQFGFAITEFVTHLNYYSGMLENQRLSLYYFSDVRTVKGVNNSQKCKAGTLNISLE